MRLLAARCYPAAPAENALGEFRGGGKRPSRGGGIGRLLPIPEDNPAIPSDRRRRAALYGRIELVDIPLSADPDGPSLSPQPRRMGWGRFVWTLTGLRLQS